MSADAAPRPIGVLLAAGRGRRMGRTKQLLPWPTPGGSVPLVAAAFDAIRPMCTEVVVVVGHERERVEAALAGRATRFVRADADAEMFESVRAGIEVACAIAPGAPIVLHPADHPTVAPATRAALLAAHASEPDRAHVPTTAGRGGHPLVLPSALAIRVLAYVGPDGLHGFRAAHPESWRRVAVEDPHAARDLDRPEDYDRAIGCDA